MTTSQLSPLAGELRGQDLQTLRDYALEAPWEWQQALLALIAAAEEHDQVVEDLEAAEDYLAQLRDAAKDAIKELRLEIEDLLKTKVRTEGTFAAFKKVMDKTLDDLDKASDEPEPSVPAKVEMEVVPLKGESVADVGESLVDRYAKLRAKSVAVVKAGGPR